MGPSGSGKTTLLDVLAGRKTAGTTSGKVTYGNEPPTKAFLRRHTGYVEQFGAFAALRPPDLRLRVEWMGSEDGGGAVLDERVADLWRRTAIRRLIRRYNRDGCLCRLETVFR